MHRLLLTAWQLSRTQLCGRRFNHRLLVKKKSECKVLTLISAEQRSLSCHHQMENSWWTLYHSSACLLWKVFLSHIPPLLHSATYTHLPTGTPELGDPKLRDHLWGCVPYILVSILLPASYFLSIAGKPRWSCIFSPSSLASGHIKPVSYMPPHFCMHWKFMSLRWSPNPTWPIFRHPSYDAFLSYQTCQLSLLSF